jgi:putative ABC transport system permease protein
MVTITDILRYSYKVLTEKRFRAVLTIIGIAIGPLALVMMTSVVRGYASYVESQLLALGQNTIVVTASSGYTLTDKDLDFIKGIEGVADAKPFYMTQAVVQTVEGQERVWVYAIDTSILLKAIGNLQLEAGSFPAPNQVTMAAIGHFVPTPKVLGGSSST